MRMALLAERITAAEALEYGLVSGVYPDEELEAAAAGVIDTLVSGPAVALSRTKQAINAAAADRAGRGHRQERRGQQILLGSRDF